MRRKLLFFVTVFVSAIICNAEYCLKMGTITNGDVQCTDGNMVGSQCSFSCNEAKGYKLFPESLTSSTCNNSREWDSRRPCCALGCPRYAVMDFVIILDSSSSVGKENWEIMKTFVREIINTFEISSSATRIAMFRYNRVVDTATQILLSDFPDNKQGLLRKYDSIPYDGSGTLTGQALSHALNTILSPLNGNRPEVKDVVLTITDGISFDDVMIPSQKLREKGTLTYVLGITPSNGMGLDSNQLNMIAGSSDRVLVASEGFKGLNQDVAAKIGEQICGKPCVITCQPHPTQPINGYVSCTDRNVVGSECDFRCKAGFAILGSSNMTCNDDMDGDVGVWSSQAPTCQQIKCNPVQVNPMYGAVSCTNSNLAGSKCIFACEFEYDLIGDIEIMCDGSNGVVDGVWSNKAPRCQRKQCNEAQPAPMNGMRTCSGGNSIGSICEYTCHTNFVRNGPRYSTCTDYGSGIRLFDNQAPICESKQCPDAAAGPANGFRICSNGNEIGSTCEYGCNVGFKVIGPQIAVCTKNADGSLTFNDTAPVCEAIQCSQQGDVVNGQVSCTNGNMYNSVCTFQCNETAGYSLYPEGLLTATCLPDSWSFPAPCCARACLPNSVVDMIIILDSSSSVGAENWQVMKEFVKDIIELFDISELGTHIAIFRYNRRPDRTSQILLNDYVGDKQGLLAALDEMPYNGRGTWIGKALDHAKDFILEIRNGDRSDVRDVVLTITDGRSKDDVSIVSEELRAEGALTYVVGLIPSNGKGPRGEELLRIAGSPERVTMTTGFENVDDQFKRMLSKELCGHPCDVKCNPRHVAPENGKMMCSDSNMEGSRCVFSCDNAAFELRGESVSICLDQMQTGVWSSATPTCQARCSAFGVIDLVIVLDSSSSFGKKNWDMMKAFVRNILNSFEISSIAARAAIFRYNSKVYTDSQILLGDFPDNKTALLAAYDAIIHNGRGTKTGQALLHVNNTILNEVGGNRPEAQDVVITITDGRSEDDVAVVSGSLRSRGALTYAIGVMPPNSKGVDGQQMLSVAGQPSNIFIARNDFEGVYEKLIKKLDLDICGNV